MLATQTARRVLLSSLRSTSSFHTSTLCMSEKIANAADWKKKVLENEKPVVLDFYADWCGPCKRLTPLMEAAHKEVQADVDFFTVDVDAADNEILRDLQISSIPDVRLFHKGKEEIKFVGIPAEAPFREFWTKAVALSKE